MLIVGLTGGLACGKSTVAACFKDLGARVLDADQVARALVMPGSEALAAIAAHFGAAVLDAQGALDRVKLRQIIFADPGQRRWLEQLLHPQIHSRFQAEIRALQQSDPAAVFILEVPLLLEAGFDALVQRVLVVDCDVQTQRQYALERGWTVADVDAAIAAQATRSERLARADDIIDNNGPPETTVAQVQGLMQRYQELAR